MKCRVVFLILEGFVFFNITFCENQHINVLYHNYAGNYLNGSNTEQVIKCLKDIATSMEYVGAQIDTETQTCTYLHRTWLAQKYIPDGTKVLTKAKLDIRYNTPKPIWRISDDENSNYWSTIPGEMLPGSSLSFYTSTKQTNTKCSFVMIKDAQNLFMSIAVDYNTTTIGITCQYNGTSTCVRQHTPNVQLLINEMQKFTFKIQNDGVQVYVDDIFMTHYYDPENPMTAADANFLGHWVWNSESYNYLHRIKLDFVT